MNKLLFIWLCPVLLMAQHFEAEKQTRLGGAIVVDSTMNFYKNADGVSINYNETGIIEIKIQAQSTYGEAELQVITPDSQIQMIIIADSMKTVSTVFTVTQAGIWQFIFSNDLYLVIYDRNVLMDFIEFKNVESKAVELLASWNANDEADLAGYRLYYGEITADYKQKIEVGKAIEFRWSDSWLKNKRYFFAVTAYDTASNESGYSEEVSLIPYCTIIEKDSLPPNLPRNFKVKIKVQE